MDARRRKRRAFMLLPIAEMRLGHGAVQRADPARLKIIDGKKMDAHGSICTVNFSRNKNRYKNQLIIMCELHKDKPKTIFNSAKYEIILDKCEKAYII